MSEPELAFFAAGLCCPLGATLAETTAAYAGNRRSLRRERALVDVEGNPPTVATVYPLAECRDYVERLLRLLKGAIGDCIAQCGAAAAAPVCLVLPPWMLNNPVVDHLRGGLLADWPSGLGDVRAVFRERAEGLAELGRAAQPVAGARRQAMIVAALDSLIDPDIMDFLTIQDRLLTHANPHGMIPGEAAVALFLSDGDQTHGSAPLGRLLGCVEAREPEDPRRPVGVIGRGLATCYRQSVQTRQAERLLVDLNGERWRAEEFGFALSTSAQLADLGADPETPCGLVGDLGSATSLAMAALALMPPPPARNAAPAPENARIAMVSASSPGGGRTVALIERT